MTLKFKVQQLLHVSVGTCPSPLEKQTVRRTVSNSPVNSCLHCPIEWNTHAHNLDSYRFEIPQWSDIDLPVDEGCFVNTNSSQDCFKHPLEDQVRFHKEYTHRDVQFWYSHHFPRFNTLVNPKSLLVHNRDISRGKRCSATGSARSM